MAVDFAKLAEMSNTDVGLMSQGIVFAEDDMALTWQSIYFLEVMMWHPTSRKTYFAESADVTLAFAGYLFRGSDDMESDFVRVHWRLMN